MTRYQQQYEKLKLKIMRLTLYNFVSRGKVRSREAQRHLERAWQLWLDYSIRTDEVESRKGLYLIDSARGDAWEAIFGREMPDEERGKARQRSRRADGSGRQAP